MTYQELDANVRRIASGLVRHGVRQNDVFAIMSANSPEWVMVFFAAVSIGAAVTTLNPAYMEEEVKFQLKDSNARFVFTAQKLSKVVTIAAQQANIKQIFTAGDVPGCITIKTLLDDDGSYFPADVTTKPCDDLVVLPYSSGTTGKPKGTMLTHRIIVAATQEVLDVDNGQNVYLGLLPYFHIYGMVFLLIKTLTMGRTLLIMDKFEPKSLLQSIEKYKLSFICIVPPLVLFLAKAPIVEKYDLSSLQYVMSGAAPLGVSTVQDLKKRLPQVTLLGGWGLTETAGVGSFNLFTNSRIGSAGVLRPNNEAMIVDISTGRPLDVGKKGEIWIRGPNMMSGYWKRLDATKDTTAEGGWVKTGDVGYFDKDGFLYVVDRIKELIKVKGFQVAPAELEDVLTGHPAVADAAVIGVPDAAAGELPKAFVVLKDSCLSVDDIEKYVAKKVAPFKRLKGGIQFVDRIPKSPSGKILRRHLRQGTPSKL